MSETVAGTNVILDDQAAPGEPLRTLPSHALWELPGKDADDPDRFNVVGYSELGSLIYERLKHWTLITTGDVGRATAASPLLQGDWAPLFEKAADEYPERREEFLARAATCAENRAKAKESLKQIPPTKEELEDARDVRLATAILKAQQNAPASIDSAPPAEPDKKSGRK